MRDLFRLIGWAVVDLLRSRAALEAEIWTLRQQIDVLRRTAPKRLSFSVFDHLVFTGLYRLFPKICDALAIVKPDTIVRWHRAGFRLYWCWKSRRRGSRPTVPLEIRKLIREMSIANSLWGAAWIHGELLKLGIEIGQTSVAKYMAGSTDRSWRKTVFRRSGEVRKVPIVDRASDSTIGRPLKKTLSSPIAESYRQILVTAVAGQAAAVMG